MQKPLGWIQMLQKRTNGQDSDGVRGGTWTSQRNVEAEGGDGEEKGAAGNMAGCEP